MFTHEFLSFYSILRQPWNTIFSLVILKVVQTPAAVGLILCIVGATSAATPAQIDDESTVKIGVILFLMVFVLLCILTSAAAIGCRRTQQGEFPLVRAVAFALPFILVRIIYTLITTFGHSPDFSLENTSTGAVTINLFMEVLEECAVVTIYLAIGVKLPSVPMGNATQGEKLVYRFGRGDFSGGKLGLFSLGAAIFSGARTPSRPNA
jgi:uncharacterized membrane protein YhaH (DUF805 family)